MTVKTRNSDSAVEAMAAFEELHSQVKGHVSKETYGALVRSYQEILSHEETGPIPSDTISHYRARVQEARRHLFT